MTSVPNAPHQAWPKLPWLTALLTGIIGPGFAMALLANASATAPVADLAASIVAVGLMGAGMIAAAATGRMSIGVAFAMTAGASLLFLTQALDLPPLQHGLCVALALGIASISFAARGSLFARSAGKKGWWIAIAIVAGEGAIIFTAIASPGALPPWLLALLPAQWASSALQMAMSDPVSGVAFWDLLALAGTAVATLTVVALWPRRWTYLIMFGTWIVLSVLVGEQPAFN